MPPRLRTPSPGPDEPKYLTVVWPYPMLAHMALEGDVKQVVYWIASCIGSDPLLALFYKPSSPNMVIIEVSRDFDKWEILLGEHKWAEFLRNLTPEETNKVSQIFYCTFSSGRQVQKYGWLRKDVESFWFENWTRNNQIVNQPYPATCYCPTPSEDKTNAPLCRPLPAKSFPPPPAVRLPPVGSPEWHKLKDKKANAPKMQGTRSKGAPGSSRAGPNRSVPILTSGGDRRGAPVYNASSPAGPAVPPRIVAPAPLAIPTPSNARQFSSAVSPSASLNDCIPPPLTLGSSTASSSSSPGPGEITPGQSMNGGTATSPVPPLGGAPTPSTATASAPTPASAEGFTAPKRPAKGRRMNVANTPVSPAIPINVPKAAGPPSAGASTTSGWGQVSNGPWGGNVTTPNKL